MDDAWKSYFSSLLLSMALLGAFLSHAADLEYISPEVTTRLADQFSAATLDGKDRIQKAWTCDMYGMRTRLQIQRGIKLYELKPSTNGHWKNAGAGPVTEYRPAQGALTGKTDQVEDQIRITKDGHLISRLSLVSPPHTVIAYSVCSSL